MFINRQMYEELVCMYSGILLSYEKELNFAICNKRDVSRGYYYETGQAEKDKYYMFLHVESRKLSE